MSETYDAKSSWLDLYAKDSAVSYPAEGVIRIFKGTFPKLCLPKDYKNATILDVGYGDGRHFPLFQNLGLKCYGVEIDSSIVEVTQRRLRDMQISAVLKVGSAAQLPFEDVKFDYVLSWNSSYYMSLDNMRYEDHVGEMLRVLKPGGNIVVSVPSYSSFVFDDAEMIDNQYAVIRNDFFGARNGEVMRRFRDSEDLCDEFKQYLSSYSIAEIKMDWFGLAYNWLILVGSKEG